MVSMAIKYMLVVLVNGLKAKENRPEALLPAGFLLSVYFLFRLEYECHSLFFWFKERDLELLYATEW